MSEVPLPHHEQSDDELHAELLRENVGALFRYVFIRLAESIESHADMAGRAFDFLPYARRSSGYGDFGGYRAFRISFRPGEANDVLNARVRRVTVEVPNGLIVPARKSMAEAAIDSTLEDDDTLDRPASELANMEALGMAFIIERNIEHADRYLVTTEAVYPYMPGEKVDIGGIDTDSLEPSDFDTEKQVESPGTQQALDSDTAVSPLTVKKDHEAVEALEWAMAENLVSDLHNVLRLSSIVNQMRNNE